MIASDGCAREVEGRRFIDQQFKLLVDLLLLKALVGECEGVDCLSRYTAEQKLCVIRMEQEQRPPENPAYPP